MVFSLLAPHDFRIDATVMEKNKTRPELSIDPAAFYQLTWQLHAQHVMPQISQPGDELLIIGATGQTRRLQKAFSNAVDTVIAQTTSEVQARSAFWRAGSDPCIQVADYCCWTIQRKWERGDVRSYALIAGTIHSEFDAFRRGTRTYY